MRRRRPGGSALRVPDARRFLIGQGVSSLGNWMQSIGEAWLVLELSGDNAVAVGLLAATKQIPSFTLGLWGGLLVDRADRRRLALASQVALTLTTACLALLTWTGAVAVWSLFALVALNGLALVVDIPARQTLLAGAVPDDLLPNAISLNSAIFNGARIVGPALAAVTIGALGTAACFALNSASYLAMVAMLARMHPPTRTAAGAARPLLREGLAFAWRHRPLRSNLAMLAIVGTLAINFTVVLPALARQTFDGSANLLGAFTTAMGVGSLVGALAVATAARPTTTFVAANGLAFGAATVTSAVAPTPLTVALALAVTGCFSITLLASSNSKLLLDSPPGMRGRVSSLRAMAVGGSSAIGAPVAGTICQLAGARWALAIAGVSTIIGVAVYVHLDGWPPRPEPVGRG